MECSPLGGVEKPKNAIYVILSEAKNLRISISYRDEILCPAFGEAQNDTFSTSPLGEPNKSLLSFAKFLVKLKSQIPTTAGLDTPKRKTITEP